MDGYRCFLSLSLSRRFSRVSSAKILFFSFFLCFARANRNLFLGGGGEEDRGLSFLTTSWKSRFLNRRVEFFFSFSLFIFISLSFHSQLLSDIWVSGESLTKLHESIYIEIIFSTRWNEWLESVVSGIVRLTGKFSKIGILELYSVLLVSKQEEENDEVESGRRDSFRNFLFLGPYPPRPMSLSLYSARRNRAGGKLLSDDDRVLPLPGLLFSTWYCTSSSRPRGTMRVAISVKRDWLFEIRERAE